MADISRDAMLNGELSLLAACSRLFSYLWECAWQQAPATGAGDSNGLHHMRVALRRLRAALRNFEGSKDSPLLDKRVRREFGQWCRTIGKLTAALGEVRDLDVQDSHLKAYRKLSGEGEGGMAAYPGLAHFERTLYSARANCFGTMVKRLTRAQEPGALREEFARWALGLPALQTRRLSLGEAALIIIPARIAEVRALGYTLQDSADSAGHHELRKALRALRYALESLQACCGHSLRPALKTLVAAQDMLGEMQDRAVLAHTAWGTLPSPPQVPAAAQPGAAPAADVKAFVHYGEMRRRRLLGQARRWWATHEQGGVLDDIARCFAGSKTAS
jgi:CHAD domain-containing protein